MPIANVTEEEKEYVLRHLRKLYAPAAIEVSEGWFSYERYVEVVRELNMKASPGIPLCRVYSTIGQVFNYKEGFIPEHRLKEVWLLVQGRVERKDWDPFRVFLKKEPVKKAKKLENRYRLIFSGSLVDQIIDHMLFDEQNKSEVENMWRIPSKVGWSPFGINCRKLLDQFDEPVCLDKSFWDWSMQKFVTDIDLEYRLGSSSDTLWMELVKSRYKYCFEDAIVQLSDGTMYKQICGGLMKSGLVNTISTNSRAQIILDLLVHRRNGTKPGPICAQGDDTIQEMPRDLSCYVERLRELGVSAKTEAGAAFCGFDLRSREPLYKEKHLAKMTTVEFEERESFFLSMQLLYAFSVDLGWIQKLVRDLGLKKVPVAVLRALFELQE
jgi:hypothetical protein